MQDDSKLFDTEVENKVQAEYTAFLLRTGAANMLSVFYHAFETGFYCGCDYTNKQRDEGK